MKKTSTFLFTLISCLFINAQNFEKVFETKISKKQEYSNFLAWSSQNQVFIKGKEILTKDEETGQVITSLTSFDKGPFFTYATNLSLRADLRDNKYRLSVSDPIITVKPADIDYQYLSPSIAKIILPKLEAAKRIGRNLDNVLDWSYLKIVELKEAKNKDLEKLKSELPSLTKKSDIRYKESKIEECEEEISLLSDVISSVDKLIDNIYKDIEKTVNVNDDF